MPVRPIQARVWPVCSSLVRLIGPHSWRVRKAYRRHGEINRPASAARIAELVRDPTPPADAALAVPVIHRLPVGGPGQCAAYLCIPRPIPLDSQGEHTVSQPFRPVKLMGSLFGHVLGLYMTVASFSFIYFNFTFAKDNSFTRWMMLGFVVPSAKAMVWPYFVYHHYADKPVTPPRSVNILFFGLDALNRVDETPKGMTQPDNIARVMPIVRALIDSSQSVSRTELDSIYPGLGEHFLDDATESARSFVQALEHHDSIAAAEAVSANLRWRRWWNDNADSVVATLSRRYRLRTR